MMNEVATIPYEPQSDPHTTRDCGAACLSMTYRSLGKPVPQAEIWPGIAKENRFGSISSTTHLMVKDALNRGFAALAFQARHPLQTLQQCRDLGIRAILNHRLNSQLPTGHYTVLVDIDHEHVVLHDPFYGAARKLSHSELLELWQPNHPGSEVVGYILIAVAAAAPEESACHLCRTPIPPAVQCPHCQSPVTLQPDLLLRCVTRSCIARAWNYVCCPTCDYTWTFSFPPAQDGAGASEFATAEAVAPQSAPAMPTADQDPWMLTAMFGKLDEFINQVRDIPIAADHPDVKKQLDFIVAGKEKLKLAQAEHLVSTKAHFENFRKLQQAAQQKAEDHRKKMEEFDRPSAPLDPTALGRALLKNLGWDS